MYHRSMMPPSRPVCKPLLATALLLIPILGVAKEKRLSATNGRFSYAIPKGLKTATVKNAIAGWKYPKDRTTLGVFPVSHARKIKLKSAFKATSASQAKAKKKEGDWFVSKVYKKSLGSGLPFYFYSAHQKGTLMKVSGYFVLGGDYYFVSGWTSRRKYGLPNVYAALSTIQPISGPRRGSALKGSNTEKLIEKHGPKKKRAPGVRLGTGSGTPKMIGAPKKSGGPVN